MHMTGDLQLTVDYGVMSEKKKKTFVNQTVHTIINDLTYWNRLLFVFRHTLHCCLSLQFYIYLYFFCSSYHRLMK